MDDQLRKLQLTQLGILKDVDSFCKKYGIRYSLYGGSLIGAVRHQGFIPWDDDLDICMSRDDYNRFIELWESIKPNGYILQNKDNTPLFTQSFTKIRKEHTTYIQDVDNPLNYHTGIFIDVFPVDRIPGNKLKRILFQSKCILYLLFCKEYIPAEANFILRLAVKVLFFIYPKRKRAEKRNELLKWIEQFNGNENNSRITTDGMKNIMTPLPSNLMDEYISLKFEDGYYMCMAQYDTLLRLFFGDYMTPPPESERVPLHNAKIIDYDKDYYELMKN